MCKKLFPFFILQTCISFPQKFLKCDIRYIYFISFEIGVFPFAFYILVGLTSNRCMCEHLYLFLCCMLNFVQYYQNPPVESAKAFMHLTSNFSFSILFIDSKYYCTHNLLYTSSNLNIKIRNLHCQKKKYFVCVQL